MGRIKDKKESTISGGTNLLGIVGAVLPAFIAIIVAFNFFHVLSQDDVMNTTSTQIENISNISKSVEENKAIVIDWVPGNAEDVLYINVETSQTSGGVYHIKNMNYTSQYVFVDSVGNQRPIVIEDSYTDTAGGNWTIVRYYPPVPYKSFSNTSTTFSDVMGLSGVEGTFTGAIISLFPWILGLSIIMIMFASIARTLMGNSSDEEEENDGGDEEDNEEEDADEDEDDIEEEEEEEEKEEETPRKRRSQSTLRESSGLKSTYDTREVTKKTRGRKVEPVEEISEEKKRQREKIVEEYMKSYSPESDNKKKGDDFLSTDKFINSDRFS